MPQKVVKGIPFQINPKQKNNKRRESHQNAAKFQAKTQPLNPPISTPVQNSYT